MRGALFRLAITCTRHGLSSPSSLASASSPTPSPDGPFRLMQGAPNHCLSVCLVACSTKRGGARGRLDANKCTGICPPAFECVVAQGPSRNSMEMGCRISIKTHTHTQHPRRPFCLQADGAKRSGSENSSHTRTAQVFKPAARRPREDRPLRRSRDLLAGQSDCWI
ncbi:hypothetical protein B0T25DRAFT_258504 [Lasiosphaeria hispida]|uniref:Uncharacterized protein n=1 Tax=Lasiosphaeria hispida TaxID=260671 RepID=A0AAJ0MCX6_9PEZI|nr:hypothetical protein B0T25DRAFT_258504 [Lasiosphaeria hispida]